MFFKNPQHTFLLDEIHDALCAIPLALVKLLSLIQLIRQESPHSRAPEQKHKTEKLTHTS
jgi:hypothetical protein